MRHSIGDVSRMLGMTTAALHFYEKEGVIDTPKVESGRRYYEEADVYRLVSVKKYRTMGVSLKEIAEQFSAGGMSSSEIIGRLQEKQAEAEALARSYAQLASDIGRLKEAAENGVYRVGRVEICQSEDVLVLCTHNGSIVPEDKAEQQMVCRWLEAMPACGVGVYREKGKGALMAYTLPAARAKELGIEPDGELIHLVPGGLALHAAVCCGAEIYSDPGCVFAVLDAFAREHRFEQTAAAYGVTLFVDCAQEKLAYYFDVFMPIG